jgi:hypothetical protein
MTAFLYYSFSLGLTENEIFEIDKKVGENRKVVYEFTTNISLNGKRKIKRIYFYVIFMFAIAQPLAPCGAVLMPLPPTAIHKLYHSAGSEIGTNKNYPQIALIPASKVDKIRLTNEQMKQFKNLALQLNSGLITIEEAVLQLRGGSGLTDVVGIIAFIIFINWCDSPFGAEAFRGDPLPYIDPIG